MNSIDNQSKPKKVTFHKLTPFDLKSNPYQDAVEFVFLNDDIRNVAITGSYGSGKSSVLNYVKDYHSKGKPYNQSLENEKPSLYKHNFLTISLASFDCSENQNKADESKQHLSKEPNVSFVNQPQASRKITAAENTDEETDSEKGALNKSESEESTSIANISQPINQDIKLELEGQILNQLIHKLDHSNSPKSRFTKTLDTPGRWSVARALLIILAAICIAIFFSVDEAINNAWIIRLVFSLLCIGSLSLFFFLTSKVRSLRKEIKRVGLKNAEVELFNESIDSRFDIYMDDIIYLLNANDFDVVIFEDLDRFNNIEIFEKLREINDLANASRFRFKHQQAKQKNGHYYPLRFFYVIKDDLFSYKEKTKFFDFIIPIVPFMDPSNSHGLLLEQLGEESQFLDSSFLKGISPFLDETRLVYNIMNEYRIYQKRLEDDSLEGFSNGKTKLFAAIVLKNLFPTEFAQLQMNKGYLYDALNNQNLLREKLEEKYTEDSAEAETTVKEAIAKKSSKLEEAEYSAFKRFFKNNINEFPRSSGVIQQSFEEGKAYPEILKIASEEKGFTKWEEGKLQFLENDSLYQQTLIRINSDFESETRQAARTLEHADAVLSALPQSNLQELISFDSPDHKLANETIFLSSSELIKKYHQGQIGHPDVIEYMINNGFIDETYHHYISIFREGALSKKDNEFIMLVSLGRETDPERELDNPHAVITQLDSHQFKQPGARNYQLLTALISFGESEKLRALLDASENTTFFMDYVNSNYYDRTFFEYIEMHNIDPIVGTF